MKKSVYDVAVNEKRVLLRVDFNVPMQNGIILHDARLRASLPTIRYLIEQRARVIILSHLGRPNGYVVEELRMDPIAARLSELLGLPVEKVNNCVGPEVHEAVNALQPGQVLVLENVRFHPGETVNDLHFASQLASLADLLVNDAFSTSHRIRASTVGIAHNLPAVAGLLMEREITGIYNIRQRVRPPFVILLGGVRLAEKSHFIDDSLERKNTILLGGVLANTFLKAKGFETGQSLVETQVLGLAREFMAGSRHYLELPGDFVITDHPQKDARQRVAASSHVPPASYIIDIGPGTIERYSQILSEAGTVIWNGPMGLSHLPDISRGTKALARRIAGLEGATKIAGGGETLIALENLGLSSKFDFLSTGGAAFLDALGNEQLPAIRVLQDREEAVATETSVMKKPHV